MIGTSREERDMTVIIIGMTVIITGMTVIIIGMTIEETNMIVINITDMDITDLMDTGKECIYLRLSPICLIDRPVSISSSQMSKLDSEELLCVDPGFRK